MTLHNLHLSLRHLSRQKLNTGLHIVGLTIGMSVCLMIGLFLHHELSYDGYHTKAHRIYRINSIHTSAGQSSFQYASPLPLADALRTEGTGVEKVVLAHPQRKARIDVSPDKRFEQDHIVMTEPEFLDIFDIDVLRGNARLALATPYHVLLTETTAKKFFGDEDPIGKTLLFKKEFPLTVAGVIRDLPSNTTLPISMLISYMPEEKFVGHRPFHWTSVSGTSTFVLLPEHLPLKELQGSLREIADKNINQRLVGRFRMDFEIQPLKAIHTDTQYGGGFWVKATNVDWLWIFATIGISVLLLACINFINLSTAQAITRAKEVGIRKSVGAGKLHLITSFLMEAALLSTIAGILSIAIVQITLPAVNTLLEKNIPFHLFRSPEFLITCIGFIALTCLLAGLYPAWVITRFNPALSLKPNYMSPGSSGKSNFRKALTITQFTLSAGLLMALLIISAQVTFMRSKSLGFDQENVVNVPIPAETKKTSVFSAFVNQVREVKDLSFACAAPGGVQQSTATMNLTGMMDPKQHEVNILTGDDRFCHLYGLKLLAGRFPVAADTNLVSKSIPDNEKLYKAVLNEKAIRALGFTSNESALGKRFWHGHRSGNGEIIGVVADFNTNSLHTALMPVMFLQDPELYEQAAIKIQAGGDVGHALAGIKAAWEKTYPNELFRYTFLDQQIDSFYNAEGKLYLLFKYFAALAMVISCLGLWGLVVFTSRQRTKEIGIRKVLGASVNTIIVLLSKDFLAMVAIAVVIASPVIYYLMDNWLQRFAYRVGISWEVFAVGGMMSILIAILTMSAQTTKAAISNPVDSLRNE